MTEYICGLSPRTVSVLPVCFLMETAKALMIIQSISFKDLSVQKRSRKLEYGNGFGVCVCACVGVCARVCVSLSLISPH